MLTQFPARQPQRGDHVFLVDGSSYIFRAYHALPPLNRKSDGLQVNAVLGFCNMLWKLLRDMKPDEKPTHLAVVFDKSEVTFRTEVYPAYKAHRPDAPSDLLPQFAYIREAVRAFDIPCLEQDGYEADDLIATYAREACEAEATTTIVSSDKDLMQLVGPSVVMYDTMKDRRIGPAEVMDKFGVGPEKVIEVQSLIGDSTDNVPGVPGIGIKTAAQLIGEYGDIETLLARAGEIKQEKRRQALIEFAEQARISKRLVTLDARVPLKVPIAALKVHEPDYRRLIAFTKAMEFTALTRRVAEAAQLDPVRIEADPQIRAQSTPAEPGQQPPADDAARGVKKAPAPRLKAQPSADSVLTPHALAAARAEAARRAKVDPALYQTVRSLEALEALTARAYATGIVAITLTTTSLDAMQAQLVGVALAVAANHACYVPLGHRHGSADVLFDELVSDQINIEAALARLKPLLEDAAVLKLGANLKYDWLVLARHGIECSPGDDITLISYALDAGKGGHALPELAEKWLAHRPSRLEELIGTGKARLSCDRLPIDRVMTHAAEKADLTLRLWHVLKPRLVAESVATVFETLERPMTAVLARMECRGIAIDRDVLSRLSDDFGQRAAALEAEIRELAGADFNPGSTKQLGDMLFGKMGFPGGKKTKTGAWSTSAAVLEELAEQGNRLPQKILRWREVSKLRSTYTEALPGFVNPQTHRVHTSFALASTSTGRLSSFDPNLQNIPIRSEEGRKIRRAFVAREGFKLVSADYSQIELRLLAEIADIGALQTAFRNGLDIHALTASEMFGVPVLGMPAEIRRRAKAINFGIIYGISAFGLANQLGISREEAATYIKKYFERFPGIRDFMEESKNFCRQNGYVRTLFGRKCHYPEIAASNPSVRSFNERAAVNARLQGSAADIIRRAMVRVEPVLKHAKLAAAMLLQVHDELVFEVPDEEVDQTLPVVIKVMAEAPHPAVNLSVPLQVEARAATNWDEAH
jgi:DNA polymerase I